jgi:hypothetical protein
MQQASVVGSDALLIQTKLEEALRLTAATARPNPLRTSMCCHLLACVVKAMSPLFAEAMLTISHELLDSIYYTPDGAKPTDTKAATPIYFRGTPFFMLGQELDQTKMYAALAMTPIHPPCPEHGGHEPSDAVCTIHMCRGGLQLTHVFVQSLRGMDRQSADGLRVEDAAQ